MYIYGDSQNHSNLRVLKMYIYGEHNDSSLRVPINVHLRGASKSLKFEGPHKCTFVKIRVFDMPLQAHGMSGSVGRLRQACLSPKNTLF